jgi:hypothetical protein
LEGSSPDLCADACRKRSSTGCGVKPAAARAQRIDDSLELKIRPPVHGFRDYAASDILHLVDRPFSSRMAALAITGFFAAGDRPTSGKARRRCQLSRAPAGLALGRVKLMTPWAPWRRIGRGKASRLCPCNSDVQLLSYGGRVIDLDPKIAHRFSCTGDGHRSFSASLRNSSGTEREIPNATG